MSKSNLVPIVDPMYDTYANSVAPKSINTLSIQSLSQLSKYTILDRIKHARWIWKYLPPILKSKRQSNVFMTHESMKVYPANRSTLAQLRINIIHTLRAFCRTPDITKYVRSNKQRLSCNEKQVNQIAEGSLEWDDAACVLKYDQLEKVERTVLQKMLNVSKPS